MAAVPATGVSSAAEARPAAEAATFDIAPGTLPAALAELSRQARVSIGTDGPLPPVRTRRVRGTASVAEALDRLLAGSGYVARRVGETAWRIERAPAPRAAPAAGLVAEPAPLPLPPPVTIVVTATKRPEPLLSLPAAVAAFDTADLPAGAHAHAGSAAVAARVEGLSLTGLGPGRNRMFLRGVADSAFGGETQSTVAVVLDEARLTYAAPDPDVRLVDMARVEVLEGPQGALYGTGALGGIYHMVTNPPVLDETSVTAEAAGSFALHGDAGSSGSVVANLPLVRRAAALRLVAYGGRDPGWIDSGARADVNGERFAGARARLAVLPAPDWRIDLTGFAQWLNSADSRYTYTRHSYVRPDQIAEPHDNDLHHVAGRVAGKLGGADLVLASAMTWHEVDDIYDATIGAADAGLADPRTLTEARAYRTWDSEARLLGEHGRLHWLVGLSHLEARQSLDATLLGFAGETLDLERSSRASHDSAAWFDLTLPLTGTLAVDGGGRLFRSSIAETLVTRAGAVRSEADKAGFTPSLALTWQPDPRRQIYLRYGSAFRQGATSIAADGSTRRLPGDELASLEAGWREDLGGGSRAELGLWASRWEDVQSDTLGADGLVDTVTAGKALVLGASASMTLVPAPGWRIEAGAEVTDARLIRNELGYELHDRRLPVIPDFTLRGALRRDVRLGRVRGWARLDIKYVGPARMSFDPALDRRMGNLVESGLELGVARGRWSLDLSVRNLFGSKGTVFAYGNPLRYPTMDEYIPQQPRALTLGASMRF